MEGGEERVCIVFDRDDLIFVSCCQEPMDKNGVPLGFLKRRGRKPSSVRMTGGSWRTRSRWRATAGQKPRRRWPGMQRAQLHLEISIHRPSSKVEWGMFAYRPLQQSRWRSWRRVEPATISRGYQTGTKEVGSDEGLVVGREREASQLQVMLLGTLSKATFLRPRSIATSANSRACFSFVSYWLSHWSAPRELHFKLVDCRSESAEPSSAFAFSSASLLLSSSFLQEYTVSHIQLFFLAAHDVRHRLSRTSLLRSRAFQSPKGNMEIEDIPRRAFTITKT